MASEVVILGGGVGGTIVANLVAKQCGDAANVTVVDTRGIHVYQPGFLYVAVGQEQPENLEREESSLLRHEVNLVINLGDKGRPEGADGDSRIRAEVALRPAAPGDRLVHRHE